MKIRLKHWLVVTHRWLGVAMCLLFALWFATGIIMMYVEYPELTEAERLAERPALALERVAITPDVAIAAAESAMAGSAATAPEASAPESAVERLTLTMLGDRPVYEIGDATGGTAVVFADTGERFAGTDQAAALRTVAHSGFMTVGASPVYDVRTDMDQWTVSEVLHPHRPLHRVRLNDDAGTVLYVSNTTGQIVRDTDRAERVWNWLGSTIHWIYPWQLRQHRGLWVDIVVWLSIAGLISVLTGAILGFLRLRLNPRYSTGSMTPWRGMMKWHHLLGLASLLFVSTFMFSGLMSMTPWGIFDPEAPLAPQLARYTGGELRESDAVLRPGDFDVALASSTIRDIPSASRDSAYAESIREIEWRWIDGLAHLVIRRADGEREPRVAGLDGAAAVAALRERIERAVPDFLPEAAIVSSEVLEVYDDYYYTRHNRYRPLPVLRVRFDDAESSWYHIDLHSGALVTRETVATRLGRWLFNGLHSLDFVWLTGRGPVWDVTVIALCIAGFAFTVTSVVIGLRRVRGRSPA